LLPANIAEAEVGVYSACYKLGLFMVLYRTAYTLGIEPFFSLAMLRLKNAPQTYAMITKYFVILPFILLSVIVFADLFKMVMIPNDSLGHRQVKSRSLGQGIGQLLP
jgi:hypothetical protein